MPVDFAAKHTAMLWILPVGATLVGMKVARRIDLPHLLQQKSFFLFGPRATGKSTCVAQQLADRAEVIDLLDSETFFKFSNDYKQLEAIVAQSQHRIVVIDEIQKLPQLLNDVHRLIERRGTHFLLTSSSTRKLRRGGVNLLAGRAWEAQLFSLTYHELPQFDLERYLFFGGLPAVYLSAKPAEELRAYVSTYMRQEIQEEGLVRRLPAFTRFLHTMALSNGEILNYAKIANDCQTAPSTVAAYVQVLADTLLAAPLPPWLAAKKRKAVRTSKLYFFDTGVARAFAGIRSIERNSNFYDKSFEHFIWMELRAWLSYTRREEELSFWRTRHGYEVDFLIGSEVAIEVKASKSVSSRDLKGLRALAEEGICQKFYLISQDSLNKKYEQFHALHWRTFLDQLWEDKLL